MARYNHVSNNLDVSISTHGYYEIYKDKNLVFRGATSDMGIEYDPSIDSFSDSKFYDDVLRDEIVQKFVNTKLKEIVQGHIKRLESIL